MIASPQLENGYTRIANEIMDALILFHISGQELRVVLLLLRKTYGYHKKESDMPLSEIVLKLSISKERASKIVGCLQLSKIITVVKKDNGMAKTYCFNKDYKEWVGLSKKTTVVKKDNKPLSKKTTQHEFTFSIKENKEKGEKQNGLSKKITVEIPNFVDAFLWDGFKQFRKEIKKPLTPTAEKMALKKLTELDAQGFDCNIIIKRSIENGWQGLFPKDEDKKPKQQPKSERERFEEQERRITELTS